MLGFREEILLLVTVPVYVIVIGTEIVYSYLKHKQYYSVKGILANVYLTLLNMGLDLIVR